MTTFTTTTHERYGATECIEYDLDTTDHNGTEHTVSARRWTTGRYTVHHYDFGTYDPTIGTTTTGVRV